MKAVHKRERGRENKRKIKKVKMFIKGASEHNFLKTLNVYVIIVNDAKLGFSKGKIYYMEGGREERERETEKEKRREIDRDRESEIEREEKRREIDRDRESEREREE
jgi:hypothetical protein